MAFKTYHLGILSLALLSLVLPAHFALGVIGNINLTITNPTSYRQNFDLILNLPANLSVRNPGSAIWNQTNRTLTFSNFIFEPNGLRVVSFSVEGEENTYALRGTLIGRLDNQDLRVNMAPFSITLSETSEEQPTHIPSQQSPENQSADQIPWQTQNQAQTGSGWSSAAQDFISDAKNKITSATENISNAILKIKENEQITRVSKKILVPISTTLAAAGTIAIVAVTGTTAAPIGALIYSLLSRLFTLFSIFSYRVNKRSPWGRVINNVTKNPIVGALVSLIDMQFKKTKETQLTDKEGRFGFLASPGSYYLVVKKGGFENKETQTLNIITEEAISGLEITLEPTSGYDAKYKIIKVLNFINNILEKINPLILILGTFLAVFLAWLLPNTLNVVVLIIYLALDILKIIFSRITLKSFGRILNSENNQPIDLAIIRIFDAKNNWILSTKITDAKGRYNFLTLPGLYYFTVSHKDYSSYQSMPKEIKKASIEAEDIRLKRQPPISGNANA